MDEPSGFSRIAEPFTIAPWPWMFLSKEPLGHFHTLLLSDEQDTKQYSDGCNAKDLMLFLWLVSVTEHFPAARSQSLTIRSIEPLMNCGSAAWETNEQTA